MGSLTSPRYGSASHLTLTGSNLLRCGFACNAGYMLTPGPPSPGLSYPPASPHHSPTTPSGPTNPRARPTRRQGHARIVWLVSGDSALAHTSGYGNINPLSIDYACRPRLRPRLTLGGSACPRNPWSSGGRVSHPAIATHACILTPTTSTTRSHGGFSGRGTLPYPPPSLNPKPPCQAPRNPLREERDAQEPQGGTRAEDAHPRQSRRRRWRCRGFGGVLEPRYIVGAESLDQ